MTETCRQDLHRRFSSPDRLQERNSSTRVSRDTYSIKHCALGRKNYISLILNLMESVILFNQAFCRILNHSSTQRGLPKMILIMRFFRKKNCLSFSVSLLLNREKS